MANGVDALSSAMWDGRDNEEPAPKVLATSTTRLCSLEHDHVHATRCEEVSTPYRPGMPLAAEGDLSQHRRAGGDREKEDPGLRALPGRFYRRLHGPDTDQDALHRSGGRVREDSRGCGAGAEATRTDTTERSEGDGGEGGIRNPASPCSFSNLQILKCRQCQECRRCRGTLIDFTRRRLTPVS
jgi:hypothetical protein